MCDCAESAAVQSEQRPADSGGCVEKIPELRVGGFPIKQQKQEMDDMDESGVINSFTELN